MPARSALTAIAADEVFQKLLDHPEGVLLCKVDPERNWEQVRTADQKAVLNPPADPRPVPQSRDPRGHRLPQESGVSLRPANRRTNRLQRQHRSPRPQLEEEAPRELSEDAPSRWRRSSASPTVRGSV